MKRFKATPVILLSLLSMGESGCSDSEGQTARRNGRPARTKRRRAGKYLTLTLGGAVTMRLIRIPAGTFTMGSPPGESGREADEGPRRTMTIPHTFYMGVCEVTQEQYQAVMGKNPSSLTGAKNPVEKVSWHDALAFCQAVSDRTGRTIRLPTEAEWEYACRAGSTTRFSFGDRDEDLHRYGNYADRSAPAEVAWRDMARSDGYAFTAPVGSLRPNPWGLHDMHGNVWEWCQDVYEPHVKGAVHSQKSPYRVLRGGSWVAFPRLCRSAVRCRCHSGLRFINIGFRIAVDMMGVK